MSYEFLFIHYLDSRLNLEYQIFENNKRHNVSMTIKHYMKYVIFRVLLWKKVFDIRRHLFDNFVLCNTVEKS